MRSSARHRQRGNNRNKTLQRPRVEGGEVRAAEEQPSVELVHDVEATLEEQLVLARKRAAIEKTQKRITNQQYWLRRTETVRRESSEGRELENIRKSVFSGRKKQLGLKKGLQQMGVREESREVARRRLLHKTHVDFLDSTVDAVRTAEQTTFGDRFKRSLDVVQLRLRAGEAEPQDALQLRDYLSQSMPQSQSTHIHGYSTKGYSEKKFIKHQLKYGRATMPVDVLKKAYAELQKEGVGSYRVEWTDEREFSRSEQLAIADFSAQVPNAVEKIQLLQLLGIQHVTEIIASSKRVADRERLVATCNLLDGREQAVRELAEAIPWRGNQLVEEIQKILSDPAFARIVQDEEQVRGFADGMGRLLPEAHFSEVPFYVDVISDEQVVTFLDKMTGDSLHRTPRNLAKGLLRLRDHGGLDLLSRREYTGIGYSSHVVFKIHELGDRKENEIESIEQDVKGIIDYDILDRRRGEEHSPIENILENDSLTELAHVLVHELGLAATRKADYEALQSFEGIERVVIAVATATLAYNPGEPIIQTIESLKKIVDDEKQIEWILDPEYAHFVRRTASIPALSADVSRSNILGYNDSHPVPLFREWFEQPHYAALVMDPSFSRVLGAVAAERGVMIIRSSSDLEALSKLVQRDDAEAVLTQIARIGSGSHYKSNIMNNYITGDFVGRMERETLLHPEFTRLVYSLEQGAGIDQPVGEDRVRWIIRLGQFFDSSEKIERFLAEVERPHVLQRLFNELGSRGLHCISDVDAAIEFRWSDFQAFDAYMNSERYGRSLNIADLIAFARNQNEIAVGEAWWNSNVGHKNIRNDSGYYDAMARLGAVPVDIERYPLVQGILRDETDMNQTRCIDLVERINAVEQVLELCVGIDGGEHSEQQTLHPVDLDHLPQLADVVHEFQFIAEIVATSVGVYGPVSPGTIHADQIRDLYAYGSDALVDAAARLQLKPPVSLSTVVARLSMLVRYNAMSADAQTVIRQHVSFEVDDVATHRLDAAFREDFSAVVAVQDRLEALGFKQPGQDWSYAADVYDKNLLPAIEHVVSELGYPLHSSMHVSSVVRFIEGGGVEAVQEAAQVFGCTPAQAIATNVTNIRRLLQSREATAAIQLYIGNYPDAAREALASGYDYTGQWESAGRSQRVFEGFIRVEKEYGTAVPEINNFSSFHNAVYQDERFELTGSFSFEVALQGLPGLTAESFRGDESTLAYTYSIDHIAALTTLSTDIRLAQEVLGELLQKGNDFDLSAYLSRESKKQPEEILQKIAANLIADQYPNTVDTNYTDLQHPILRKAAHEFFSANIHSAHEDPEGVRERARFVGISREDIRDTVVQAMISQMGVSYMDEASGLATAFAAELEGVVFTPDSYSVTQLLEMRKRPGLRLLCQDDTWGKHVDALEKVQKRAARTEHDPWLLSLNPMVEHLVNAGVIDRSSESDGRLVVDFIQRFGMVGTPILAGAYMECRRAAHFSEVHEDYQDQLRRIIGSRAEKMSGPELINELVKYQGAVRSDLLADEIPRGLTTAIGQELFAGLKGRSNWGRNDSDVVLFNKVLAEMASQLIVDSEDALGGGEDADFGATPEQTESARGYIRARVASLVGAMAGEQDFEVLRNKYYKLKREWNNAPGVLERFSDPDARTRVKPGYEEMVLQVPEVVIQDASADEAAMAAQKEREEKVIRLLKRALIVEGTNGPERHVTPLGALMRKVDRAYTRVEKAANDPRAWWPNTVADLRAQIEVQTDDLDTRLVQQREKLEKRGLDESKIQRALNSMQSGFDRQAKRVEAFLTTLEQVGIFSAEGGESVGAMPWPPVDEAGVIEIMNVIAKTGIKHQAVDALLMDLSLLHMNSTKTAGGYIESLGTAIAIEMPGDDASALQLKPMHDFVLNFLDQHYLDPGQDPEHTGHAKIQKKTLAALRSAWHVKGDPRKKNELVRIYDEVERLQAPDTAVTDSRKEVTLVPSVGPLRVYSGDLGNACYTSKHHNLAKGEYPGLTSMTLVTNRNTPQEQFAGSVLFIETSTSDGKVVLHIRANNPRENLIKQVDSSVLVDQVIDAAIETAKRRGIGVVTLPLDRASMSSSNRPDVSDAYRAKFGAVAEKVTLVDEPETNFNGYPNWNPDGRSPSVIVWTAEGGRVDQPVLTE